MLDLRRREVVTLVGGAAAWPLAARGAASQGRSHRFSSPVKLGLIASLSRPVGNATGVYLFLGALDPKKSGLLRDVVPHP